MIHLRLPDRYTSNNSFSSSSFFASIVSVFGWAQFLSVCYFTEKACVRWHSGDQGLYKTRGKLPRKRDQSTNALILRANACAVLALRWLKH